MVAVVSITTSHLRTSPPRITIASTASAPIEAAAPGSGADEHSSASTSGLPLRRMRTNKEHKVNGGAYGDRAKAHEPRVDRRWPDQAWSSRLTAPVRTNRFMEAICLALTVRERHHGVFHQDKRWLVGRVARSEAQLRGTMIRAYAARLRAWQR